MTLEFAGNMLCSAGVSYFHVYPNGDVYRCLADYNARRPPMFNLKRDGWKGAVDPTVCDHERCYNACDLDWTTKWQVDGQGRLEKTFEGQRKDIDGRRSSRFLCSQRLESPAAPDGLLHLVTDAGVQLHLRLLRLRGRREADQERLSLVVPRADRRRVDRHLERHPGALRVRHPQHHRRRAAAQRSDDPRAQHGDAEVRLLHHLQHQPQHHGVHPRPHPPGEAPSEVEGFGHVPIGLSGINCSLHPTSKGFNWELFKGSVLLLRNAGFHVSVNYVGYPLQLYLAPEYKAWCEQNKVEFTLSSWQGEDNEGNIARYSLPERTFFEEIAPSHRKKANELVFMDCRYDVMLDNPVTRVLMADVLTLTGRIRNLSPPRGRSAADPAGGASPATSPASGGASSGCASCAPARRTVACRRTANWSSSCPSTPAACRPASTRCGSTC